ncbi:hypothetical protein [Paenibacillus sacheonensis]|uniref:Uncharacterized protein n=1 Tax=Paenibacillus sacheonensis TaxID=742054 RepID=A0A7X4YS52_9BACL|nr:hypothetical protein [Paenibacillus sacheonensis]MBM7566372.1 hypothetical protein [Paenibacillus sacheonensis]NBC70574.1 hypothetical protein [Paenibacillus sacheonensis]
MNGNGIHRLFLIGAALFALSCDTTQARAPRSEQPAVQLIVKSSPNAELASRMLLDSRKWGDAVAAGITQHTAYIPMSDTYLSIDDKVYSIDSSYRLYDAANAAAIQLSGAMRQQLAAHVSEIKSKHYGKLLTWPEAKSIVTMKSNLSVVDLETGLRFEVQRRAGSTHADVQPLTKRDTEIMKRIYQGKWSWRRRAILVVKDGQTIAASMNGMPHGGDGIPDNDFQGHFCIHFLGSSTHKTGTVDMDHQTMVHKAAGKLQQYAQQASPNDVAELFFIAINQRDAEIMTAIFPYRNHEQLSRLKQEASAIIAIRRESRYEGNGSSELLVVDIPARAVIYRDGSRKAEKSLVFQLRRTSVMQPWTIEHVENAL